ncbi:hypothetical protein EV184_10278 [Sinorhizobium americanum]|uniref:Metallophosphoesterase n=1 Tax=Sinorhizobium americanum TaxID=194963 RepID=A0A4R2C2T3_9HYPH|nr:hypothetical protein EV184_10278 [Sinorhizobium americanum]
MIYFTSDTHFGEQRVLNIDRRPFSSLAEHDAALIANWNDTVSPEDEIWHLGDFASKKKGFADDLLSQLNGSKHLIVGNNDPPATVEAAGRAYSTMRNSQSTANASFSATILFGPGTRWESARSTCTATPMAA